MHNPVDINLTFLTQAEARICLFSIGISNDEQQDDDGPPEGHDPFFVFPFPQHKEWGNHKCAQNCLCNDGGISFSFFVEGFVRFKDQ